MANKGLKEENTMLSFSISDVNISIDLAKLNKNIIATIPLTIDKGPMPINVGVIYNDQNKNVVSNFGNGFRFSEDKTISLIPGGGGYKIDNADGSENIFTFYGPTEDGSIYKDIYGNKLYDLLQRFDLMNPLQIL